MDILLQWFDHNLMKLVWTVVFGALFYYVGGKIIDIFIHRSIQARGRHWRKQDIKKRQDTLSGLFVGIWKFAVIVTVFVAVFGILFPAVNIGTIFAGAGIVGIALGFGAQSLVKDFLSGLFIIIENQYRVGDVIEQNNFTGTVERIGARSTSMRDMHGNLHYFPNGLVEHIVNLTSDFNYARFDVKISPKSDLNKAIKIINQVGANLTESDDWKSKIIEAPAFLRVGDIDALAVTLTINGKTQAGEQWDVIATMRRELLEEFEKQGIKLAMPIPPGLVNTTA